MANTKNCPCGSGREYNVCCEPYLKGTQQPPTAEALMRSRYTAYVKHEIEYIAATYDPGLREDLNLEDTRRWAETSEWQGLTIHRTEKGGEKDDEGIVEFTVSYDQKGLHYDHNEKSFFKKIDGRWFFVEGVVDHGTVVRTGDKTGRNDPCPCGSGKKYKKCCGA